MTNTRPTPSVVADEELLPCPFCGTTEILIATIRDGCEALCKRCNASMTAFNPKSREKVAIYWNTRAAASDRDVLVKTVEQEISAWAFAHDIDGAIRNELFTRIRAALVPLGGGV